MTADGTCDMPPLLTADCLTGDMESSLARCGTIFWEFQGSDSGCRSVGVEMSGRKWFVKYSREQRAVPGLRRARELNRLASHKALPRLANAIEFPGGLALVYEWVEGLMIRQDQAGMRFRQLPLGCAVAAVDTIFDLQAALADLGFVAVDLYDGCFLYNFDAHLMHVCDLDEYRRGPFILQADRLPGSKRFMAPEEWIRGSHIDQVTNVFTLGRTAAILLGDRDGAFAGWRGTAAMWAVVQRATRAERGRRFQSVAEFNRAWRDACDAANPE